MRLICRLLAIVTFLVPAVGIAQTCTPKFPASELVQAGKLQMSINPTLPPQQYVDEKGELQGLNVELGREIARRLCVEPEFLRMDFPAMIPGLRAGRFDAIDTGLFWTEERSKLFFLVPYAQQAISVATLPNSPLTITRFEDLAGRVVVVERATYQERRSKELNDEMVAKGMKAIDFRAFATATESLAALRAGQVEALVNIDETARDFEKRGIAKVWLKGLGGADITFAFRNKAVAAAAAEALNAIRADGVYDQMFDRFGMNRLPGGAPFAIRGTGPL
jgi:polar amino acid transport system substrate-binding protein